MLDTKETQKRRMQTPEEKRIAVNAYNRARRKRIKREDPERYAEILRRERENLHMRRLRNPEQHEQQRIRECTAYLAKRGFTVTKGSEPDVIPQSQKLP